MLTAFWPDSRERPADWEMTRKIDMQEMMLSSVAKTFAGNLPEESATRPQILMPRRVLPAAISGNSLTNSEVSQSGWPSAADVPSRMDGTPPEYVANMPLALR